MSVDAHSRNAMRANADRVALVDGDRRWTFAELADIVDRVAGAFQATLQPGSRVCLYMQNCAEYPILQLALEQAQLVRVPLNSRYTALEVERVVEHCGAKGVFCDHSTIETAAGIARAGVWVCQVDGEAHSGMSWAAMCRFQGPRAKPSENYDSLCSINYTSGSSGLPKGVMLSHRNWMSVYRNMLIDRDIRREDRLAHIGPLSHASGAYLVPFMLRGATNVIVPQGKLDNLLPTIERERVTAFTCVPTVLTRLLNDERIDQYDLSSIRWIGYGAEAIQRNTLEKALSRWGPVLTQNYGLTEAMMTCCFLAGADHVLGGEIRFGCIGKPYTFVDVALRNEDGEEVPAGEIGEITIQAEHVMQGYWNQEAETSRTVRNGWLWSGDLARRDSNGFVYIVGRSKEMLISGGFNIYPAEVEACLSSCPGVQETAVLGVPDEQFGEICVAFVTSEPSHGLTAEECESYCKPRIGIKTPKRWLFIAGLPRTGNGKVDKAALRARLQARENQT
jgi:acyl-CoA synthetase (AMP-forming)/AMP-acid ligase II